MENAPPQHQRRRRGRGRGRSKPRFYENEFPSIGDLVVVQICKFCYDLCDMGWYDKAWANVHLVEYSNKKGRFDVPFNSENRHQIGFTKAYLPVRTYNNSKSTQSEIIDLRAGHLHVAKVVRIDQKDQQQQLIYLHLPNLKTKREQERIDTTKCWEKYHSARRMQKLLLYRARSNDLVATQLKDKAIDWPLCRPYQLKTENLGGEMLTSSKIPYSVVREFLKDEDECNLHAAMQPIIPSRTPVEVVGKIIQTQLKLQCSSYEGVDAIKEAIILGIVGTPIQAKVVSPPIYALTITMTHELKDQSCVLLLNQAIATIRERIVRSGGSITITKEPHSAEEPQKIYGRNL